MSDDQSQVDPTGAPSMRMRIALAAAASVVAVIAVIVWVKDDNGTVATDDTTTTAPSTTGEPPTSATSAATSTTDAATTSAPDDGAYDTAVWPWADSSQRFDDPVEAARSFAVDYVGFTDPVVGEFMQGDSRSGEVEIKPEAIGPVSTVFVRQLGDDDTWWVLGAATANIEVDEPTALSAIDDPVTLKGRANAFEGNVNVTIRVDGVEEPIVEGFVTGMMGDMGPFESQQAFPSPKGGWGAIVFRTLSAKDGSVWEAGVVRVGFIGGD